MSAPTHTRPTRPAPAPRPRPGEHPDWCAKTHACGLGEHRAEPVSLEVPGRGVTVLTRVMAADGRQHVEIRTRLALAPGQTESRAHLARILCELDAHLRRVTALTR